MGNRNGRCGAALTGGAAPSSSLSLATAATGEVDPLVNAEAESSRG